ncbi:TetR/AcrR family transcriptional regulator [Pontimicrobium aquaticum]|uniref:TetR/AcrR family transcriptional regulator n=1 Tax=Pontimicrobium aquaticum TaxID=2565367 RepID=A0A4U0ESC7_9FLAO|nr:TetR/AcrR family transcriptional regulator [Pontimicrobium aquaticum]TJY34621.1 TetR/AcrR family transcriptional regulator [Pontimicrobium aquaticum]
MREKIIHKSADLFLNYGFKSVTMDDIANALGISKKTIYQHFENKTKLVEATTLSMFSTIAYGIDCICALEKNPIEEIYDIKRFVSEHLKNEKSSPQFQLQKYYPKIFNTLKNKQFEVMYQCVKANLNRGMDIGIYRTTINVDFVTRIYFNCMLAIKDDNLFPSTTFSKNMLMENYLEYHLRGICTSKGLDILSKIIQKNQS